jgi:NhaP-type Na+/H+ or K+/H+ antiporter
LEHSHTVNAALTIALAGAAGVLVQSLAHHLRLPGIVLLLGAGVFLGPDVLNLVQPDTLGSALQILVGFAVAVILFEGGLNLNVGRLRRERGTIQRLLTMGVLVTALGGAVSARMLMGWEWTHSILFGTLVIVTGPTVITPLLRRIKVDHQVESVLEAEGVLIDSVGAVIAVVALEVVIQPTGGSLASGSLNVVRSLGAGLILGLVGGALLALLLRFRKVVPEGMENVFTLSMVLALFQGSNFLVPESGIMAVTAAGIVVGNIRTRVQRDLLEFKEQLTVLFIGMLFVLLAADVRVDEVRSLGWPGLATVASLMFVVRPLNIAVSTVGSTLGLRERAFLAWLAPRGIVAAAVASLFAQTLDEVGIGGGAELRALVFLVIACTVLIQGLTGGMVARVLHLRRPAHRGYAILGANELGHVLGKLLRESGEETVFLDSNPAACKVVEEDGFKVIYGSAVEQRTLQRAQVEDRAACIAVTPNAEVNLLFCRMTTKDFGADAAYLALGRGQSRVTPETAAEADAQVLFGVPRDLDLWALRLRRETATVETWEKHAGSTVEKGPQGESLGFFENPPNLVLPMLMTRGDKLTPVSASADFKAGDQIHFAVSVERRDQAEDLLRRHGWQPA